MRGPGREPGQTLGQELTSLSLGAVPSQLSTCLDKCTPQESAIPASVAYLVQTGLT